MSNGSRSRERIGEDRAAGAQRVPHADFVPDVGIVQGQVGDDKLGKEQILEHVEVDRAAAAVGVRTVRHQSRPPRLPAQRGPGKRRRSRSRSRPALSSRQTA